MPQNNEVIGLLIASGVLVFLIANRKRYTKVFSDRFLMLSFIFYFASFFFTVAEDMPFAGVTLNHWLNYAEHLSSLICSGLLLIWICSVLSNRKEQA